MRACAGGSVAGSGGGGILVEQEQRVLQRARDPLLHHHQPGGDHGQHQHRHDPVQQAGGQAVAHHGWSPISGINRAMLARNREPANAA